MQLVRNNNHTLVGTKSKTTTQEEEHMLIVLQEQVLLASLTREWQWVSDKMCIMNCRQTSRNCKMQMILTEHQELTLWKF
jgi:hypothetical protein